MELCDIMTYNTQLVYFFLYPVKITGTNCSCDSVVTCHLVTLLVNGIDMIAGKSYIRIQNRPNMDPEHSNDFLERTAVKRKWASIGLDEKLLTIEERKLNIENSRHELKEKDLTFIKDSIYLLKNLCGDVLDIQTITLYSELLKKVTFTRTSQTTNELRLNPNNIIISVLCDYMGYKNYTNNQLIDIHKKLAIEYMKKYNTDPVQHKHVHKGRIVWIDSYTERDINLMQDVIKECLDEQPLF